MFLLNNKNNRPHAEIFTDYPDAIFDLNETQVEATKNRAWHELQKGSIVTVIRKDRKIREFHVVDLKKRSWQNRDRATLWVLTGRRVASMEQPRDMTELLTERHVSHPDLPNNMYSIGFNVGNLGDSLGPVEVITDEGERTNIRALEQRFKSFMPSDN